MPFSFKPTALVTSEELSKFFWGVTDATTELTGPQVLTAVQITNIEMLVNAITAQFEKYIGYGIVSSSSTEVWDGAGSDELVPTGQPITAVASIKFSSNNDFSASTPIATNLFSFNKYSINILHSRFPSGRSMVQIVYTSGFSPVPDDIKFAAMLQFQYAYKKLGKGDAMVGVQSVTKSIGGGSEGQQKDGTIGSTGLISEAIGMLSSYCRMEAPLSIMYSRTS